VDRLSSHHIEDKTSSSHGVWGTATLAKLTLQKLFFHGRLLIAGREGNCRLYDLPERVLPSRILAANEPAKDETSRWLAMTKLRQRRLTVLKREELRLVGDEVQGNRISDADAPTLRCVLRPPLQFPDFGSPATPSLIRQTNSSTHLPHPSTIA
jgi:hypothetical protein